MYISGPKLAIVVNDLAQEVAVLLMPIDQKALDLNEKGGVDAFAEIHMGDGIYLNLQLTATLNRREPTETVPSKQQQN